MHGVIAPLPGCSPGDQRILSDPGQGLLLPVMAAVFIGGTSIAEAGVW
jgi:hypothetical protein